MNIIDEIYDIKCEFESAQTLLLTVLENSFSDRELDTATKEALYVAA
jgi:hypothetical protein